MTGDNTTRFYRFGAPAEAEAYLEAMKAKGLQVRSATLSPDPDGGGVLLAVEAAAPDEAPGPTT